MQPVRRLLVISDIHGQIRSFEKLLRQVKYDPDQDLLFLLGDYVDRGEDPCASVKKVRSLERQGAIVLKGNHEDMMEKALTTCSTQSIAHWAANGGGRTLSSYGVSIETVFRTTQSDKPELPDDLQDDLNWISRLNTYAETDHYLFVHAGVDPEKPLDANDEQTLLWTRAPFIEGYHGEKTVIFGHTPTMTLQDSANVYFGKNNIIGIDGGCVFGGQMNCLELPSKRVYHVP